MAEADGAPDGDPPGTGAAPLGGTTTAPGASPPRIVIAVVTATTATTAMPATGSRALSRRIRKFDSMARV